MHARVLTLLATAAVAMALPAPAAALVKVYTGKNCKIRNSPNALTCPAINWSIDGSKYTVDSISATAFWEAQVSSMRPGESNLPTAEYVFGAATESLTGGGIALAFDTAIGKAISDTPGAANSGTFTYSLKTTSDDPRTVHWLGALAGGGTQSYIRDVKLTINYSINPPSGAPEPGTWLMLIIGFGFTGAQMRRQRVLPRLGMARS